MHGPFSERFLLRGKAVQELVLETWMGSEGISLVIGGDGVIVCLAPCRTNSPKESPSSGSREAGIDRGLGATMEELTWESCTNTHMLVSRLLKI